MPTQWDIHVDLMKRLVGEFREAGPFIKKYLDMRHGPSDQIDFDRDDGIFDYALSLFNEKGPSDPTLMSVLEFLEREYESDDGVKTVISLEFVSDVSKLDDSIRSMLIQTLPPHLKGKAEAYERSKQLCLDLAAADPWLEQQINEQIEFCEEILPHVVVGDLFGQLLERME